ncbi:hemolysin family protein [Ureibacillus chungkukjangi]|uniref:CBS domain containing-hemolysin-like protein n=1 Tax=Ureibacillus chungkukjangi TaxID=1202712 RepID=A0A318THL8_9BACL|nr:hemolysin family protein [Ureibacillus chungkukjangi]MCM3389458.1 hemolysin family protein [Ureibacillus chungkukjangi]PYF04226.1 CBS domain containing-hemolysin-like protein [Ureibacillus chungkukjangi]
MAAFFLLIAATAFFVATEFAIVKVRTTRIDQLVAEGNKKAMKAKKVVSNLDEYLSACQLGITITALGLGWLGEPTFELILHPLFELMNLDATLSSLLSFIIAFMFVTYLHVVVGELTPKTFAIVKSEELTLNLAGPIMVFYKVMYPFIRTLNGSARALTGLFGLKLASESDVAHSEEELRIILTDSYKGGEINHSEYEYVNSIFEFSDRTAKEIMVPRTEIVSLEKDLTVKEVFEVMGVEQYTRYPITDGDKDHVIGLVNLKHLLTAYIKNPANGNKPVVDYMQPVIRVFETVPISDLLLKIQSERIHMAILMDEYGGTSGLVTIEDIIEEIVGDIQDEFDEDEIPEIQEISDNHYILDAKLLVDEVNDMLGITIDDEDVDTIGGWFLTKRFDAVEGDSFDFEGYEFKIKESDGHHILYIEITKLPESEESDQVEESEE